MNYEEIDLKISEIVNRMIELAELNTEEVTISADEYGFLRLAEDDMFPPHLPLIITSSKALLVTGNYALIGELKIKVRES